MGFGNGNKAFLKKEGQQVQKERENSFLTQAARLYTREVQ